jgi:hypothetical protein
VILTISGWNAPSRRDPCKGMSSVKPVAYDRFVAGFEKFVGRKSTLRNAHALLLPAKVSKKMSGLSNPILRGLTAG